MPRHLAFLLLLATLSSGCITVIASESTSYDAPASRDVALDHAAIHVADLDRSIAFYQRVFEIDEIAAPGDPTVIRWLELAGGASLHLIAFDGPVPPTTKAVHFAVRVTDFAGFVTRLDRLDVPYSDWPGAPAAISERPDGVRQVYVQDPDGYWIEVNDAAVSD